MQIPMADNSFPRPIYAGKRNFLGLKDLVISFYAQKCQFQCAYCNLPVNSHPGSLSTEQIIKQIDWIFEKYAAELDGFQQFSMGNEGSILDRQRFPQVAMDYVLERAQAMTSLEVLSLETRPEYVAHATLEDILRKTRAGLLDVTVGFETQDDHLREVILNKSIKKKTLEARIQLLGSLGVRFTSYVLLKPGPTMTEEEGIREAILTAEYLAETCRKFGTSLVIYLNPVYAAQGTPLAEAFLANQYRPPRIQSVLQVIDAIRSLDVPVYTGLWSEDNAVWSGDYTVHSDYDPAIKEAVKQYNKTQDFALLQPYLPATHHKHSPRPNELAGLYPLSGN